jgi:hypothetical protein
MKGSANVPWRKLIDSSDMKIYREIMDDVIETQRNLDIIIMASHFRIELFRHDFTKRQVNILLFIYSLSFALGKESAYIPNYNVDFPICGVPNKKIKHELEKLLNMNIILWNKEENLFSINAPYLWKAPKNKGYDGDRLTQLFMLNLERLGINTVEIIEKLKKTKK